MKKKVYEKGIQFSLKNAPWGKVKDVGGIIKSLEISRLTVSVDKILFDVLNKQGSSVDK